MMYCTPSNSDALWKAHAFVKVLQGVVPNMPQSSQEAIVSMLISACQL